MYPNNFFAEINTKKFIIPESFLWLKKIGNIKPNEMLKTFNCGIGLVLAVKNEDSKQIINFLNKKKIKSYILGKISRKVGKKEKISIKSFGEWDLT